MYYFLRDDSKIFFVPWNSQGVRLLKNQPLFVMWKRQSLSCVYLFVTPVVCSPPGSSVRWILQARILDWVAFSFSGGSSWSKNQTQASCITCRFLTIWATKNTQSRNRRYIHFVLLLQQISTTFWLNQCTLIVLVSWSHKSDTCGMLTLVLSRVWLFWNPEDCSPPGSSVHGILQARILGWVAISFSRGSSRPRDGTWVSCLAGWFFTTEPPGKPCGMKMKVTQSLPTLWCYGLCSPWNSPGQNTGVGSLSLLQGIFLTQELNHGLLHWRQILSHWAACEALWDTQVKI